MATKINFNLWAGLQTGRVSHITEDGGAGTLRRVNDEFVMTKYIGGKQERHALLVCITDDIRLNSHWQAFAGNSALPRN